MRIAFYAPNKPLRHPNPSGDLIIARGIHAALLAAGHDCREMADFRSRWFWKTIPGHLAALRHLGQAMKRASAFKPQLWLTYHTYYKSPDILGPVVTRLLRIPYVLFQPMYGTKWRKDPYTRPGFYLNRLALKCCNHAFSNNLDDLEALGRIISSKAITYLPPGIFPEEFQFDGNARHEIRSRWGIPDQTVLVMSVARLRAGVKAESMHYLLNSLSQIKRLQPAFKLMIVGDGPKEQEIRNAAEVLLAGRTILAGKVERKAIATYYSAADIFAFPGIGESLGMVFLEAQACGLPVVALDTAGVPQVVRKGITALLVPRDNGKAMAEAINTLIGDKSLRKKIGESGRQFIQQERNLHRNYLHLSQTLENLL